MERLFLADVYLKNPDVWIMDMEIPGMDILDALERIKSFLEFHGSAGIKAVYALREAT